MANWLSGLSFIAPARLALCKRKFAWPTLDAERHVVSFIDKVLPNERHGWPRFCISIVFVFFFDVTLIFVRHEFFWGCQSNQCRFFFAVSSRSSTNMDPLTSRWGAKSDVSFRIWHASCIGGLGARDMAGLRKKGRTPRDEAAVTESHFGLDYVDCASALFWWAISHLGICARDIDFLNPWMMVGHWRPRAEMTDPLLSMCWPWIAPCLSDDSGGKRCMICARITVSLWWESTGEKIGRGRTKRRERWGEEEPPWAVLGSRQKEEGWCLRVSRASCSVLLCSPFVAWMAM